ncbi:hypothetical protein HYU21_02470 [Candidatus Woesearchaeota archaeon]|nr:hypothetical protein [Candidatus Woesearchaeota archaeon]
MERAIHDRNILDKFAREFCQITEKHCKYIVVSGFLAISSGRTRGTEDIDMIIEVMDFERFKLLFEELTHNNFICMQSERVEEVYEYLKEKLSVRFTWKNKPLPEMEVKFTKDLLDKYQLENRVKLKLTGLDIWFSNVNINVAFKEELLKSPKDLEDAKHLIVVYSEMIDEEEIRMVKKLINRFRL